MNFDYFAGLDEVMAGLSKQGAFLTVKDRDNNLNVMTIGWALFGIMWKNPVCMVAVRNVRYTHKLLGNADDFTVTIPLCDMGKELVFCGTHSGKDVNKFDECGIKTNPAKEVKSPVISIDSARYYECRIVQLADMDKNRLDPKYKEILYQDNSFHTFYFGEIVASY